LRGLRLVSCCKARIGIGNGDSGEGWNCQAIASSGIGGTISASPIGSAVHGPLNLLVSFILTTINNVAPTCSM